MRYMVEAEEQRKNFIKVIDYLKSRGIKQKDIGAKIGLDSSSISKLCSGEIKYISDSVLENLHVEFNINPNFIRYNSEFIIDIPQLKFEGFESFVEEWEVVDYKEKSYLHFSMDENFYNFLLEVYTLKENLPTTEDNKAPNAFLSAFESLKRSYSTKANSKNYVLIPSDDYKKISKANKHRRKALNEVIDIIKLED